MEAYMGGRLMGERHYLYEITNRVTQKKYVGVTVNPNMRFRMHRMDLDKGEHHNKHLQRAWEMYGGHSFDFDILNITRCEEDVCLDEMAYIHRYWPNCYNMAKGNPDTKYSRYNGTVNKQSIVLKPDYVKPKDEVPEKGSRFRAKLEKIIEDARRDINRDTTNSANCGNNLRNML
jgi:group I intron endonuclease